MINTDLLLVSAESRGVLERLPAICNTDNTLEVDDNANLIFQNGSTEINGSSAFPADAVLAVNGNLLIHSDTCRQTLEALRAVNVTGSLLCPASLLTCIKDLYAAGKIKTYPDDCVVLPPVFTPDEYFHLRAREGQKYYAEQEIRLTAPGIDLGTLRDKKVQFISPRFFVPAEKAADALELFNETASMEIIPQGYAFIDACEELSENLAEDFYQFNVECSSVKIVKEEKRHILENSPRITLDKDILTASPQGVLVRNSAVLTIEENITPQDILDHVEIVNCARVDCTEKQKAAVYQKSTNVPQIGSREENGEPSGMLGILLNLAETKMINADKYVL